MTTSSNKSSQPLSLRPDRPGVAGIRKNIVYIALFAIAGLIGLAVVIGLGGGTERRARPREVEIGFHEATPSQLADLPATYADVPQEPVAIKKDHPDIERPARVVHEHQRFDTQQLVSLQGQNSQLRQQVKGLSEAIDKISADNQKLIDQIEKLHEQALQEESKAWSSGLFFKVDDPVMKDAPVDPDPRQNPTTIESPPIDTQPETLTNNLPPDSEDRPPTDQQRKLAFLNETVAPESHLDQPFLYPRSRYEILAGTVIPAALLTGINTDLPGDVIATVTSPVFDTVTGQHLLIPQGARLYGAYDSQIANGQNRALLVWHRLLLPNGRSIQLNRMRGTDTAGYAGVEDQVDYHVDKLFLSAVLSTAIAFGGNLARSASSNSENDVGDTIAQEASKFGSSIIERQLDVQPTITIRPGWPLRVVVNRDMRLAAYEP